MPNMVTIDLDTYNDIYARALERDAIVRFVKSCSYLTNSTKEDILSVCGEELDEDA